MTAFAPESSDGLPDLCGSEHLLAAATADEGGARVPDSRIDFARVRSAFAVALHMHQPLIPAGAVAGDGGRATSVVSNLRFMLDHPEVPDAHNAPAFLW